MVILLSNLQLNNQIHRYFLLKKMRKAFAMQKLLTFFSTNNIGEFQILTFETLTIDIVSFEQLGPDQ